MAEMVWLSYPLAVDDPRPPAIPAPELTWLYTIDKHGANVQILKVANHTGTHLDTPRHVIADGLTLAEFSPQDLMYTRPAVIDMNCEDTQEVMPHDLLVHQEQLRTADIALFRFGYAEIRRREPSRFSERCPGFGVASGRWLREQCPGLRAIGMDVPSVAVIADLENTMRAHHELLGGAGRKFLILEDMKLDLDLRRLREVHVHPWRVSGMDSGPCSVIGILD